MIFFKFSKGFEENIRVKLSGNDVKITKHRRIIHDKLLHDPQKINEDTLRRSSLFKLKEHKADLNFIYNISSITEKLSFSWLKFVVLFHPIRCPVTFPSQKNISNPYPLQLCWAPVGSLRVLGKKKDECKPVCLFSIQRIDQMYPQY